MSPREFVLVTRDGYLLATCGSLTPSLADARRFPTREAADARATGTDFYVSTPDSVTRKRRYPIFLYGRTHD